MAISVVCPGCYTRFQVHDRFGGKRGPCPKCQTLIDIPKESVVVHAPDEFASGGKTIKGRAILKPLTRLNTGFKTRDLMYAIGGAVVVLAITAGLGSLDLGIGLRNIIGVLGLFLVAFPLVLFGREVLQDPDDLEEITRGEILKKSAICAAAYAVLWICFEFLAKYMQADSVYVWVYLIPFAFFSLVAAHIVFDLDFARGLLHYFLFFAPVLILRWLLGFGWIWNFVAAATSGSSVAPPPPPPGLGR